METKLECPTCDKKYISRRAYRKHICLCEFVNRTPEELESVPSTQILYALLLDMTGKYSKLEERVEKLTKWANTNKRKLNIIEWLNEQYHLEMNFEDWVNNIQFNREHLEMVFEYNYISGVMYIFQDLLPLTEDTPLPIRCFDQKDGTLFVYNGESWGAMTKKQFETLFWKISKQLVLQLGEWQNENTDKMQQEEFGIIYATNVQKVMGGKLSKEQLFSQVKKGLYKYLKMNLKNIIQYEFSF